MLTVDTWELLVRYHATHFRGMAVDPCELWLASNSLHKFGVVSVGSLCVGVARQLNFTASLFKMAWACPHAF